MKATKKAAPSRAAAGWSAARKSATKTRRVSRELARNIGALCDAIDEVVQRHTDEALRGRDSTSVDVFLAVCSATDQLHAAVSK